MPGLTQGPSAVDLVPELAEFAGPPVVCPERDEKPCYGPPMFVCPNANAWPNWHRV